MRWCVLSVVFTLPILALSSANAGDVKETRSALETDPKGWIDLLTDADLKEWKRVSIPPKSKLKDGNPWKHDPAKKLLTCNGVGYHEMLLFDKEIADGIFHVEWRFEKIEGKKGYNSGVYARNSADGTRWHQAQVGSKNVGFFFGNTLAGGKEGRFRADNKVPQRGKEAGEWNTFEITCKGKNLTLWVNGAVTAEWKTCEVEKGYFGLEAEGYLIEFKNIKYKSIQAPG
jgi:hypothetical protein